MIPIHNKPTIFIDDTADTATEQNETCVPVITIEGEEQASHASTRPPRRPKWHIALLAAGIALLLLLAATGVHFYRYYCVLGVPVAVTPSENIEKLGALQHTAPKHAAITLRHDSVLGVALDLYAISGARASLTLEQPDTADTSLLLYSRSADYTSEGVFLGSLVIDGKEMQSDASRLGYCAMAGGRMVIGISRSEAVMRHVRKQGGSYFRQFVLLSAGVMPHTYPLHGKVERRAIGRMPNDSLYYIVTRHKETLWDFADALREYGFVDAIYITGGASLTHYRSPGGTLLAVGDTTQLPDPSHSKFRPWLVFRKE